MGIVIESHAMSEKLAKYHDCEQKLVAMLEGEPDDIVRMATIASVLSGAFEQFYWTGFYRLLNGELVVGPYQGTPACMRIQLGRGVCGTAAETGATQVVADVHAFEGHIACDAASQSEVVVPVKRAGEVIAVLDIDSTELATFDAIDAEQLERLMELLFESNTQKNL